MALPIPFPPPLQSPTPARVTLTAEAIARYGVVIATAQTVVLRPTLVAPARASLDTEAIAHVGSPLRGRAIDIRVRRGDQVAQGDTLCVIESPELGEAQAEFLQRRIAREAAAPAAELAKVAVGPGQAAARAVAGDLADGGAASRGRVPGGGRRAAD